ncbi:sensor histidine kinase [Actinoplanes palleronii]|uniref:Sensor-like histidine kinase SenX3 n=1 Tax=Actinoplanes palleronii TaxID=113570 RepID=A0ABQ4BBW0_9ACTN|nr:ATP-binding protein [Actinoplanes palleronii]GIE68147.1 hypothetical protein Apa02nite_042550 [Actinoplanes palleronii]
MSTKLVVAASAVVGVVGGVLVALLVSRSPIRDCGKPGARLSRDEMEAFFEHTPAALHVKNLDGRYLMANRTARRNLGHGDEGVSLVGTTVGEHLPATTASRITAGDRKVAETLESVELEVPIELPGEPSRWYLSIRFPLLSKAGVLFGTGGIALDITTRKATQEEVTRLNEDLGEAVRELDAFAYSVSHDLRAPLRSATGFSQILLDRYASALDRTGQDYLRRVLAASERMTRMVDDLLALSHLGGVDPVVETVDLTRMTHDVIDEIRCRETSRDVQVVVADGLTVSADAGLLLVVVQNLLTNAWKFTAQRDDARIEVGAGRQTGHHSEFFVRDNGAGFDMAYADKLFVPFQRLHDAGEFPGTGIGLATTRRAIARQGGRIWATAAPGHGATFTFTLPAVDQAGRFPPPCAHSG